MLGGWTHEHMHTISELEREMRDLINAPRRHQQLLANSHAFSQLCSSLDVIGDTELALEAYMAGTGGEQCDGDLYLRTYGVLQVLVVQQDALVHVAEAVQLALPLSDEIKEMREIRNDAIGHPTRRGKAPGSAFNDISRSFSIAWWVRTHDPSSGRSTRASHHR